MKTPNSVNIGDWFLKEETGSWTNDSNDYEVRMIYPPMTPPLSDKTLEIEKDRGLVKEVLTDNGFILGLDVDGEVWIGQLAIIGWTGLDLPYYAYGKGIIPEEAKKRLEKQDDYTALFPEVDTGYSIDMEKPEIRKKVEKWFDKLVSKISKLEKRKYGGQDDASDFNSCVDWQSVGEGCRDKVYEIAKDVIVWDDD